MKKFLTILLSALLVACMCFSFVGCDQGEASIVGVWKGTETANFSKIVGEVDAASQEIFEYVNFEDSYTLKVTYTLNADGTYKIENDAKSAQDVVEAVLSAVMDGIEEYMREMAASYSITVDQLAQASNYKSFDAMMNEMEGLMENSVKEAIDSENLLETGTYTVSDDQSTIEFTKDDGDDAEKATILKFTANTLKLSAENGAVTVTLKK